MNICDTSNLFNTLVDPINLGLMISQQLNCLTEVTSLENYQIKNPIVLENSYGVIDEFYPFEMAMINSSHKKQMA